MSSITGSPGKFGLSYSRTWLFIIFVSSVFAWSFLYPALNWPDELYKVPRVGIDSNIYLQLLSYFSGNSCLVSYMNGSDMSYLSNVFHVRVIGDATCYYDMKLVNAVALIAVVTCGLFLLKSRELKSLYLMALIWPSNIFYMTSVNQQTLFCALSILIVVFVLNAKNVIPYVVVSIALTALDRSFVSLLIFLSALTAIRWRPSMALFVLAVLTIAALLAHQYVEGLNLFVGSDETVGDISNGLSSYYDSPFVSLALLFVSFVYLGGTNAIIGIGVDYIIVATALAFWTKKEWANDTMRSYLYAFIFTYFIVISLIPTIQTFRYYVFFMPPLLYFLVGNEWRQKKYVSYCVAMNVIYLVQAAILYG